jgi:hypothetical protein
VTRVTRFLPMSRLSSKLRKVGWGGLYVSLFLQTDPYREKAVTRVTASPPCLSRKDAERASTLCTACAQRKQYPPLTPTPAAGARVLPTNARDAGPCRRPTQKLNFYSRLDHMLLHPL